jgi:hypothetical protein
VDQPGRLFLCARCRQQVVLCSRCDRGNRYCGRACWRLSREAANREAGSRYQRSYRGRLAHARRAQRWRERRAQAPQNVTHQGCPAEAANAPLLAWPHDTTTAIVETPCAGHDEAPPAPDVAKPVNRCRRCCEPLGPWVRQGFVRHVARDPLRGRRHDHWP